MKKVDRFLIAIVAGVVVLVIAVFVVALLGPDQPAYRAGDSPDGVAHNYLLALELEEYERAYGYLSPALPGYPANAAAFEHDAFNRRWAFGFFDSEVSLAVEAVNVTGDSASVVVRRTTFRQGGLFDSGQSSHTFVMTLARENGEWKITSSGHYWADCWQSSGGCK